MKVNTKKTAETLEQTHEYISLIHDLAEFVYATNLPLEVQNNLFIGLLRLLAKRYE